MTEQRGAGSGSEDTPLPPIGSATRTRTESRSGIPRRTAPDTAPWTVICLGAGVFLLGGLMLRASADVLALLGVVVLGLGAVLVSIGTIAEGIRLGARWVRFDRGD